MKWGGNSNYQKVVFQEVAQPERLVWHHHSSTDSDWNDVANPMMAGWPRLLLTTVTFADEGDRTKVILSVAIVLWRLTQVPLEATDAEIACFAEAMSNMDKGWGSGYAILDEILAELRAGA